MSNSIKTAGLYLLESVAWVIVQVITLPLISYLVILIYGESNLVGVPAASIASLMYVAAMVASVLVYTFVAVFIKRKHGINSRKWWKHVGILHPAIDIPWGA